MDGYVNNKARVLNKWYQLFKQKNPKLSIEEYNHWKNVIKCAQSNFKNDYINYFPYREFHKYCLNFDKNSAIDISKFERLRLGIDCNQLVFINGQFSFELSDKFIDPWILQINRNKNRYNISIPIQPTMSLYLIECLSNFLIHIKLPKKSITEKPLYLLYISSGSDIHNQLVNSHYYHYLEIEKNSSAQIIEHFVSMNSYSHFIGSRMLISVGNQSKLNHIKLIFDNHSNYHISHQDINLKKSSKIKSTVFILLGPKFTCHRVNARINHEQSSFCLKSLVFLSKQDIGDIRTYLEHNNQDYSVSQQLHKIIASDYSTGIFNGLIKVNQNSKQTNAKMTNNNLLLDQFSTIHSIPKLEIYSDSIQCSHGSTIGQINSNHLFYLNTRGISQNDAWNMLIRAFAIEIIDTIKNPLLYNIILTRINKALNRNTIS